MVTILTLEELIGLPPAREVVETVTIEGLGTVAVRALSLREHREMREECQKDGGWDEQRWNALLIMNGLAAPKLTYDEAVAVTEMVVGLASQLVNTILRVSRLVPAPSVSLERTPVDDAEASFSG